ncbi:MAG TPA: DJ-1/PfpI family protein [Kofleriaceae bacterium]|nr:DJ-1/PfpI family protein [Kofleriaceae bacterium]
MAKVAVLVGEGFEDSELTVPLRRLLDEGHHVVLLGAAAEQDLTSETRRVRLRTDAAVRDHRVDEFGVLFIPGGRSPAGLREHPEVVSFVEAFCRMGRPVAAICHGAELLVAARQGRGRRMAAPPELLDELRALGAELVDEPVVEDGAFVTARGADDLDAFCAALLRRAHRQQELEPAAARSG